ncbi:hypothetical protein [Isoptericola dokdonensis]|uniref:Uncharacterized protein n=1 Tax=Isoptericola dokdonensis DS-3 TaxID=1300344 RepID=A0A168EAC1_9MICO|nr:hypothetical protein [Isoptericola dokdonensis]ANC29796.1 hypothetical protein I598_0205 [Isoptericola dokdonensis DS-3]
MVALSGVVAAPAQARDTMPPTAPRVAVDRWLDPKPTDFSGLYAWYPRVTWAASRDAGQVTGYQVQMRTTAEFGPLSPWATVGRTWRSADARSMRPMVYGGDQICLRVRARDTAGNVSAWSKRRCATAPLTPIMYFDGFRAFIDDDGARTHEFAVVSTRLDGFSTRTRHPLTDVRGVRVSVRTGPTAGRMKVYAGKRYLGTVNARSKSTGWHSRKVTIPADRASTGRIRFVPVTKAPVHVRFVWPIR